MCNIIPSTVGFNGDHQIARVMPPNCPPAQIASAAACDQWATGELSLSFG